MAQGAQPRNSRMAQAPHFNVVEATIADVHRALRKKTCTCELLVTEYLQRIAAYDQSTGTNSISSSETPRNHETMSSFCAREKLQVL